MNEFDFEIEKTKDGLNILRINKDDKWIYIGSKYNMKLEINKFVEKFDNIDEVQSVILIYGFGTGEHIKALRDKYKNNEIVVFEPNKKLINYINELEWVKLDKRISVFFISSENKISEILDDKITEFNVNFVNFMWFANYDKIYSANINDLIFKLREMFTSLRIDRNTKKNFSEIGFNSLISNIKYMINGIPADAYEGKYKNKPAVIVSAGPSLEKNIDLLKQVNGKMIIISGGRTLKPLLDKGIKPDLLVVVDPLPISYELCKDYIEDLNIPLLFYEGSNVNVVEKHKGDKLFYTYNKSINRIAGHELKRLELGGSVAHIMTSYAIMLGCDPIIFIGQDLAYTDNKSHAGISKNSYDKNSFEENNDIYVEDINGGIVRTSLLLNEYRINLEKIIESNSNITFINSTEGGARIKGTIEMDFNKSINKYKTDEFDIFEHIDYSIDMKKNGIECLKETKENCEEIIKKYKKSIELLKKLKASNSSKTSSKILIDLEKIDDRVKENYKKIDLVESLLYPIIYDVMSEKSDKRNNDKYIYERNMRFYSEIIEKIKYALKKINEVELAIKEM